MPEPLSIAAGLLAVLYQIIKRNIDRDNTTQEYNKQLASELHDNCHRWSELLTEAFRNAAEKWDHEGREAAAAEIKALQMDFQKIDYNSLKADSAVIQRLLSDPNFHDFADSCIRFYAWAVELKELVHGHIQDRRGDWHYFGETSIKQFVDFWCDDVKEHLERVSFKWHEVKALECS